MSTAQTSLFENGDGLGSLMPLCELTNGQEADFFALLCAKEELTTRDGKPYHRVSFRDASREVSFPIWNDTSWSTVCRDQWIVGEFYKLRALHRETNYGPQLEIRKIRSVIDADAKDGFTPGMCLPASRFDPQEMYDELIAISKDAIDDSDLSVFVQAILDKYHDTLLTLPAAKYNHHAHMGGYLEHVLNVARSCVYLADKYADLYCELQPPLDKGLVVAGGILHDIGKIRELTETPAAEYTPAGNLIGHILQGRDIIREMAVDYQLEPEKLLRLEHIIVAHQRLPEWGSPKPPMTPEALIVHHADDLDAKLFMMVCAIDDENEGPFTSSRNPLRQKVYRGGGLGES